MYTSSEVGFFVESLKREMALKGISAYRLAALSRVSENTVYRILSGKPAYLRHSTMQALANAVGSDMLLLSAGLVNGPAQSSEELKELAELMRLSGSTDKQLATLVLSLSTHLLCKKIPGVQIVLDTGAMRMVVNGGAITVQAYTNEDGDFLFDVDMPLRAVKSTGIKNPCLMFNTLFNFASTRDELPPVQY